MRRSDNLVIALSFSLSPTGSPAAFDFGATVGFSVVDDVAVDVCSHFSRLSPDDECFGSVGPVAVQPFSVFDEEETPVWPIEGSRNRSSGTNFGNCRQNLTSLSNISSTTRSTLDPRCGFLVLISVVYPAVAITWAKMRFGDTMLLAAVAAVVELALLGFPPRTEVPGGSNNPGDDMGFIRALRMELRFLVTERLVVAAPLEVPPDTDCVFCGGFCASLVLPGLLAFVVEGDAFVGFEPRFFFVLMTIFFDPVEPSLAGPALLFVPPLAIVVLDDAEVVPLSVFSVTFFGLVNALEADFVVAFESSFVVLVLVEEADGGS